MKTAINRTNLDSGQIVHTGWNLGQEIAENCGVTVFDYFDWDGSFLGADDNGLEPVFTSQSEDNDEADIH